MLIGGLEVAGGGGGEGGGGGGSGLRELRSEEDEVVLVYLDFWCF